ncbi:MAG: deoxynucleoside kinase [Deferribacteres bacterium]|nr:deoxynucleoside kinase [candidate division KSB1 bacterium]MCB9510185.1 deoxynucleoside kinase [Deferribacteres bacterium]
MRLQYIAIEGVIGAGKTSLTKMMAETFAGRSLLEQHDTNPFLADFYKNPQRYAFQTQLFFLLSRYRQQQEIPQTDLFHNMLIADYIFAKDRIFASITLEDREFVLYEKLAVLLERDIVKPDLVIYLQSSTERLLGHIKKRGRDYEKFITEEYIKSLNEAYNQFFFNYKDSPLLVVNANEIDFVHEENDYQDLLDQLNRPISGVQYYSPKKS